MTTYVLIHGAWHDGSCWDAVTKVLPNQGFSVYTPTRAGQGRTAKKTVTQAERVSSIKRYVLRHGMSDIVRAGHNLAGILSAHLAPLVPQRVRRLVFWNAFLPQDGNALPDEVPPRSLTRLPPPRSAGQP